MATPTSCPVRGTRFPLRSGPRIRPRGRRRGPASPRAAWRRSGSARTGSPRRTRREARRRGKKAAGHERRAPRRAHGGAEKRCIRENEERRRQEGDEGREPRRLPARLGEEPRPARVVLREAEPREGNEHDRPEQRHDDDGEERMEMDEKLLETEEVPRRLRRVQGEARVGGRPERGPHDGRKERHRGEEDERYGRLAPQQVRQEEDLSRLSLLVPYGLRRDDRPRPPSAPARSGTPRRRRGGPGATAYGGRSSSRESPGRSPRPRAGGSASAGPASGT